MLNRPRFVLEIEREQATLVAQNHACCALRLNVISGEDVDHVRTDSEEGLLLGTAYTRGKRIFVRELMSCIAVTSPEKAAMELDGSFFLIVLNHSTRTAVAISDITGSRKIFFTSSDSRLVLSDSPIGLGLRDIAVDPAGLAEYLLNGIPLQNRTVFAGVKLFPRSSIGELTPIEPHITPYWHYEFNDAFAGRSEASLIREFGEILEQATQIRASNTSGPVYVSLSGGYDSTCILGNLMRSKPKDEIRAFSYSADPSATKTDADVARATCRQFGISHEMLQIPKRPFHEVLSLNAQRGFASAHLCGEIGVWETIANSLSLDGQRPSCFFGDNAFGHDPSWRIGNVDEMLTWLPLARPSDFPSISRIIRPDCRTAVQTCFNESFSALLTNAAGVGDAFKQRDYLYFDQRVGFALLPWRDFFCGLHLNPLNPLLDKNVLEFYRQLPYAARESRSLYKKTIRHLFPELLASRRAIFYGNVPENRILMQEDRDALTIAAGNLCHPLAQFIEGDAVAELLRSLFSLPVTREGRLKTLAKICLKGTPLLEIVRSFKPRSFHVDLANIITRVLIIDSSLKVISSVSEKLASREAEKQKARGL